MSTIQMYISKKNFDVQKAQRFFKERRITVQELDLKKHKPGEREIRVMIAACGIDALIDREDKKVKEHPACYYDRESLLIPAIMECPWLLKAPVLRCGNKVTVGLCTEEWLKWIEE
ncbi:MAG: ArsC family transcriptional regulator [Clostridia bacterium]|nr:ArsC family transcriptional regulator [Clostridia bacterium]